MICLATQKESKEIDRFSMEELGIPSVVLMERAALSISNEVFHILEEESCYCSFDKIRILAVCGTGNNGGDAAAAARMLSEKGYDVRVLVTGNPERFSEMMRLQADILNNLNLTIGYLKEDGTISFKDEEACPEGTGSEPLSRWIQWPSLIIDGIFGIGLSRPIEGINKELIENINESGARIVSADIPSGINADSAEIMGTAVKADITVTFGAMKKGLVFYPGHIYAGKVMLRDCGFPGMALEHANIKSHIMEISDIKYFPKRRAHSNKGTYGRVLVIAGSSTMSGAAWFSAKAAYRSGAGLVKIFTEIHNETALKSLLPEALFSFYDEEEEEVFPDIALREAIEWADAIVVGPGLSQTPLADRIVRNTLKYVKERYKKGTICPLILDADGITLTARWTKEEREKLVLGNPCLILTPHIKEMAVFLGVKTEYVQKNIFRAHTLLQDFLGTLVLKDDRTVICRGQESFVNTRGCNGMATGGSGDVLTGILAGILAQRKGENPEEFLRDAALGVLVHGLAGEDAASRKGNAGMMAGDLLDGIAGVMKEYDKKSVIYEH